MSSEGIALTITLKDALLWTKCTVLVQISADFINR